MKKSLVVLILVFILLSFLILIANSLSPFSFLRNITQGVFGAPKSFLHNVKTGFNTDNSDLEKLKKENKRLYERVVDFEKMKADNQALKSQFETEEIKAENLLPAHIVGFLGDASFPKNLILDKGKIDGVSVGMSVLSGNNFVGSVGKVTERYSEVVVVTNKNFTMLGKTPQNTATGIVRGEDDFILFDKVEITQDLKVGDVIVTKGEVNSNGIGVRNDLIVGKITSINKNTSQPFQTAKVESFLKFGSLDTVFISISQ